MNLYRNTVSNVLYFCKLIQKALRIFLPRLQEEFIQITLMENAK